MHSNNKQININDKLELLFWKVFKNKFIYKLIMSFMDKQFSIQYDSIISVKKMINSNKISILRDKVIRNQYLTFDNLDYNNIDNDILKIFKLFKSDNDQNTLFFKQFFKYYSNYIIRFNVVIDENKLSDSDGNYRDQLVSELIQIKCFPALKILVQDYQYILNPFNLYQAVDIGSIKTLKFILQQNPDYKNSQVREVINNLKNNNPQIKRNENKMTKQKNCTSHFKSLYYLHNERIIDVTKSLPMKNNTKIKNIISKHIKSTRNQINETTPLKDLIVISKLILLSANLNDPISKVISNTEIESFSNSLSRQELKLPLSDPLFQTQHKKEIIKRILDLYYLIGKFEFKPDFYHLYFNGNGSELNEFNKDKSNLKNQFKHSFQFANYKLLVHCGWTVFHEYLNELIDIQLTNKNEEFIFSHCIGDGNKETRSNFINSILYHLKVIDPTLCENKLILDGGVLNLSLILVGYGDIELVKQFELNNQFNIDYRVISFINSFEMLEYLFENYNQHFINNEVSNFRNLKLFKHYELMVQSKLPQTRIICCPNSKTKSEILKYILERGSSIYQFKSILDVYCAINHYYPTEYGKFEMMKLLFTNYRFKNSNSGDIYYCRYIVKGSYGVSRFLNWLFINHKDYLKNEGIESSDHLNRYNDQIPNEVYFITGRYNQINSNSSLEHLINYHYEIIGINSLDYICTRLIQLNFQKRDLDSFIKMLEKVIYDGKLNLLKYIQDKHEWIFTYLSQHPIENNISNYGNGTTTLVIKYLKSLLLNSLKTNNILISQYLFGLIDLTEKEYKNNYNSIISRIYFKDKKFK